MAQAQAVLPPSKLKSFLLLSPRNNPCSPLKEKGPEEQAAPGSLSVRLPSLALFKKVSPGLSGRLYRLPKAFSSHSGPMAILWDEVRCYPHLPSKEMVDLTSILRQSRGQGWNSESFPLSWGPSFAPRHHSPQEPSRWARAECVAWALILQPLIGNTCIPGTIKWCVYVGGTWGRHILWA